MGCPASCDAGGRGSASGCPEEGRRPGRKEYTTTARKTAPNASTAISRRRRPVMTRSRTGGQLDRAEPAELSGAPLASLLGTQLENLAKVALDRLANGRSGRGDRAPPSRGSRAECRGE